MKNCEPHPFQTALPKQNIIVLASISTDIVNCFLKCQSCAYALKMTNVEPLLERLDLEFVNKTMTMLKPKLRLKDH